MEKLQILTKGPSLNVCQSVMGQPIHVEVRYQRCAGKHFVE